MKTIKYSLLLFLSLLVCTCTFKKHEEIMRPEGYTIINQKDVYGRNIRKMVLPNGLKVVLIEEKDSQFAAGALSFGVGADQDPVDHQGLAHFLEHMIFISSQNYPEVDSFNKFVKANGGITNAFTGGDKTVFFYSVNNEAYIESVKRFGDLFTHPLIQEEFTKKEVQAVDSESKKNLENDPWREWRLLTLQSHENHPWQHYSTGNEETLKNANAIRVKLFMDEYYSAHHANLVLFSNQSLDDVEKIVMNTFNTLQNTQKIIDPISPPFIEKKKTPLIEMIPIKDIEELTFFFQTPPQKKIYTSKIPRLVAYFIGHEGEGSLFSYLQKQGLVTKLTAGLSDSYETFSLFELHMQLTEKGLKEYERVIEEVFNYINLMEKTGLTKFHWEDLSKLSRIDYENQEKGTPVSEVLRYSNTLFEYPLLTVEEDAFLVKEYNPKLFAEFVNALSLPNVIITLKSRGVKTDTTEKIFGTKYAKKTISDSLAEKIRSKKFADRFRLPDKNEFIPENFSLVGRTKSKEPMLIVDNEWTRSWLEKDTKLGKPRASIIANIYINKGIQSAREVIASNLYIQSLNYLLTEYLYPISIAGVSVNIGPCGYDQCFTLKVDGYSDKILEVFESILTRLSIAKLTRDEFIPILETYRKDKQNEIYNDAYRQAAALPELFFIQKTYTHDEFLKELETVSYEEVMSYAQDVFSNVYLQTTYFGNCDPDRIKKSITASSDTFRKVYQSKPIEKNKMYVAQFLKYHQNESYLYSIPRPVNNSANLNVLYYPVKDREVRVAFRVFSSWLSPEYFAELRTKKQLGYVTHAQLRLYNDEIPLFLFLLQSGEYTREKLHTESYEFIQSMLAVFSKIDDARFEEFKQGVIAQLLEDPKTFEEANYRLWLRAFKLHEEFDYYKNEAKAVEALTKERVIAILQKAFKKEDTGIFFTFQIQGTFDKSKNGKEFSIIDDIASFKKEYGITFP